ncbi:MAG TPA: iron-sulfur cluster assembly protein [Anaerolineae bacterium]|nr:iron-sulfur cluster assembly protein [Anaerolineae bacterium]
MVGIEIVLKAKPTLFSKPEIMIDEKRVYDALRTVYDPEFTMDIVELNMVKRVEIEGTRVIVDLVLTTPFCPMAPFIKLKVERAIRQAIPEVTEVVTHVLDEKWDPPDVLGPMEMVYPDFVNAQPLT